MAVTAQSESRDDELSVSGRVQTLYDQAKSSMQKRHELWRRSYRLVHNQAWSSNASNGQVSASEIYPILAALVGWMTDQRVQFECVPSVDPHSQFAEFMQGLAHDLEKVLDSIWLNHKYTAEIEKMLWDAMIYGTGFVKNIWDPSVDDGAGNALMKRTDPFTLFVDPNATDLEDANYIVEAREMSLQELERRFPRKASVIMDALGEGNDLPERDDPFKAGSGKMPMANPGGYAGAPPIYGLPGQGRSAEQNWDDGSIVVYECWIKENVLYPGMDEDEDPYMVPEWRVIVSAGGHVLMNEKAKDLWQHGRHPYVRYVMHDLGDFWGISLVEHLANAQLSINRLLSALQHHAELVGNPVLLEDSRSGIPRTKIVNKPGQRVTKAAGSEVSWLVPPDMPNGVQELVTFWINEMERISGLSAIVRGATPSGRNAQGVLDSVQESAFVRVRLALRNLELTLGEAGRLISNLVVENYTIPRTMAIAGPTGEKTMLALSGRHFYAPTSLGADPMKYSLYVSAGSQMPISRSARAQEADTLFAMGGIDHQALLEAHDYPNRREILERMNAMMGLGVEPGPPGGPGSRQRQR